jgi:hypothetical protein
MLIGVFTLGAIVFAIAWLVWINRMPRLTPVSDAWLQNLKYDRRQHRQD